jgi:hypothetical protein
MMTPSLRLNKLRSLVAMQLLISHPASMNGCRPNPNVMSV